ncbi:glycosyltransferase family 4 protein [Leptothoe spongobia]|uniref:Glycosyltransferase family 4 protein n=1 Tax=Leptothoe spongobia TAU-MAC 1115 TaxID=1967444 RepID=A0A947D9M1_9CYAN|nr:glycosyltransferase family 4 protein [Leptothoe spongobia]MBT9313817.1 glycosyltransferase family 4 protein [Leptothoe spongobia TAU-MAC 1115]
MQLARGPWAQDTFVFIEVFGCEGGIQSYIKDVLMAYAGLDSVGTATIFLLRDSLDDIPPEFLSRFNFHCFQSGRPMVDRIRLTLSLGLHLLLKRPRCLFCGHINLAAMVRQLARLAHVPYTVLTYGKEVWFPLKPAERNALRAADRIWTISRYSRNLAAEANQLQANRIEILPCTVDAQEFTPEIANLELQQRYNLSDSRVLMTVARLWKGDPYKGVDVTIRALPEISDSFPNVKYLVIGRGDDQPRLAQLANDLGVADRVVFAGFVPNVELVEHYRLADVYVMPSQEGFGIVYLEAMACGIPVISGNNDGSADPLQDGRLGWRVPHRDPEAVALACIEALRGDDRRCDGIWLRDQTLAKFSKDALTGQLRKLLEDFVPLASQENSQFKSRLRT